MEGKQQFGDYSDQALEGLGRWREVWAPTLRRALLKMGGLNLKPIIIQALHMGDELHNRHTASSSLFADAMGANDGSSWEDAYMTLQSGWSAWTHRVDPTPTAPSSR